MSGATGMSGMTSPTDPSGTTNVDPTVGDGPTTTPPPTETATGDTTGDQGCQMEMRGGDLIGWRERSDRGPTVAEGNALHPSLGVAGIVDPTPHFGGTATSGFIVRPDSGLPECDIWMQDCPMGEKCMPWANDGGGSWNGTTCTEIVNSPDQVGDPCSAIGSGTSGMDTCDRRQMCWNVDPDTNMGTCVGFCMGSEMMPNCPDPDTACSISNGGVLALCLALCNPLDPDDCADGEGCYPSGPFFFCSPDASGDTGASGDTCEFLNDCNPGHMCVGAEEVPGCPTANCCTAFCEIGNDFPCLDGQTCIPWYDPPSDAPDPCLEDVGVCLSTG